MNLPHRSSLLLAPMLLAGSAFLAGCHEPEVAKTVIETVAMTRLSAAVGKESPQITCPSNLKAKPGSSMVCAISLDGKTHDVSITVTTVEDSTANFIIEVSTEPRS